MEPIVRKVSEMTRLKREARYIKKGIRKANALLKQRQMVKDLDAKLDDLMDRVEHPDRYEH